jgi:hypothetical protein
MSNFSYPGHYSIEIKIFHNYAFGRYSFSEAPSPAGSAGIAPKAKKTTTMKEFMLLFRLPANDSSNASPKEMQALTQKWQDWVGGLVAQDKFVSSGKRLAMEGKVLKPGGVVTDGPFGEIREWLGSFCVVKAENLDDATTLAHGCPALDMGGSVEIRPIFEY